MSKTLQEYREHVKLLADEVRERVTDGTDEYDAIHEACDGSEYVIYTGKALDCLRHCDSGNEDAWQDAYDTLPKENTYGVAAYFALCADVGAELERGK